jgi:uncharacterized SAM-binding protein YcdF (DUF218 family)
MFLLKKIVAPLLLPLSICLEILCAGMLLLLFSRRQKTGKTLMLLGIASLVLFSYPPFADVFLRSLESKYSPLVDVAPFSDVAWVVVLGGGHHSDTTLPVTSQLSESSIIRLAEGIRIHRLLPESRLLLSGGAVFDPVSNAKVMAKAAGIMGIESDAITLEERSRDTKDQARFIHEIVGDNRFILVTSASHMPRSMALFRKRGMDPIPAPADYWVKKRQTIFPGFFVPNAGSLRKTERAFYEYLGLGWAWLLGQT